MFDVRKNAVSVIWLYCNSGGTFPIMAEHITYDAIYIFVTHHSDQSNANESED